MFDKLNPMTAIGILGAGIIFTIVTWKLVANKGWVRGIALSVGGALALPVIGLVTLFLIGAIEGTFGGLGVLVFFSVLVWWSYS